MFFSHFLFFVVFSRMFETSLVLVLGIRPHNCCPISGVRSHQLWWIRCRTFQNRKLICDRTNQLTWSWNLRRWSWSWSWSWSVWRHLGWLFLVLRPMTLHTDIYKIPSIFFFKYFNTCLKYKKRLFLGFFVFLFFLGFFSYNCTYLLIPPWPRSLCCCLHPLQRIDHLVLD